MESKQRRRQQELFRKSGRAFFLMMASAVVISGIHCKAQDRAQEGISTMNHAITPMLCRFALALPEMDGPLTLGIFSPKGNLIRLLNRDTAIDSIPAGLNGLLISWDGKDDRGVEVSPGIYHARGLVHGKIAASVIPYVIDDGDNYAWGCPSSIPQNVFRLDDFHTQPKFMKEWAPLYLNTLFPSNRVMVMAAHDALQERRSILSISAQSGRGEVILMAEGLPIFEIETQHDRPLIPQNPEIELHPGNRVGTAELTLFFPDKKESYLITGLNQIVPLDAGALPMPPEKH